MRVMSWATLLSRSARAPRTIRHLVARHPERYPGIAHRAIDLAPKARLHLIDHRVDFCAVRDIALERADRHAKLGREGRGELGRVLGGVGNGEVGAGW